MLINQGYMIRQAVFFDNDAGFALGENPKAPAPYVTWQFTKDGDRLDFFWGRYYNNPDRAENNFQNRITGYQHQYKVKIVERLSEQPLYRYYSTQRPVDIGTYPKSPTNPPTKVENYDGRLPVDGGSLLAWGEICYAQPLTDGELRSYELMPSRFNPDIRQRMSEQAQVVGKWEDAHRTPATARLTLYNFDLGRYVSVDSVTPPEMAECVKEIKQMQAQKARKEARDKPASISQQIKDAQARAEADRGPAAPKKGAPDRGDR